MSVILETTLGNLSVMLYTEECPNTCMNFLKLCKIKYYNNCLFFNVQQDYLAQTGDPTGTGKGGTSLFGKLYGEKARFFKDEIKPGLLHDRKGTLAMANKKANMNASQFYITLADDLHGLDKKHTVFGYVFDGLDVLDAINEQYVNDNDRPYVDIRILHTHIVDDPFDDPPNLIIPDASPEATRPAEETVAPGLTLEDLKDKNEGKTLEEIEREKMQEETKMNEHLLVALQDIPDADLKPPENVLFVCKLNPVTDDESLQLIFERFGVTSCEIIRDKLTNDSLCYAFIEFKTKKGAEDAYFKMNNVIVDDRRIKVDFSQSVSKLWNRVRTGKAVTKDFSYDKDMNSSAEKSKDVSKSANFSSRESRRRDRSSSYGRRRDRSSSYDRRRDRSSSYDRRRDRSSSYGRRRDRSSSYDRRRDRSSYHHRRH